MPYAYVSVLRLMFLKQVTFKEDLGEIYKARIGFSDEDTEDQNWLLDTVCILEFLKLSL